MEKTTNSYQTIDEYINLCPEEIREKLQELRSVIREAAPGSGEKISYQMPAFTLNGNLVYFAAYKKHIGFYPTPSAIIQFEKELTEYDCSKGTIKFPIEKPIPLDLVSRIVRFRVQENLNKGKNEHENYLCDIYSTTLAIVYSERKSKWSDKSSAV